MNTREDRPRSQTEERASVAMSAPATQGRTISWAAHYDTVVKILSLGRDAALRKMTVDLAQIPAGATVLEVECGTGDVALTAKARVGLTGHVYGIDAAPEMVAVARGKAVRAGIQLDFQVGLIEQLAFPDAFFEVVVSSLMMHHLPPDLQQQGLAEIRRVLKPGATC